MFDEWMLFFFKLALVDWDMQVVSDCMSMSGSMIEQYSGSSSHRECLKVFFLVLQVCHFLMAGQVIYLCSVLTTLRFIFSVYCWKPIYQWNVGIFFQLQNDICPNMYTVLVSLFHEQSVYWSISMFLLN